MGAARQSVFTGSKSNIFVKNLPFQITEQAVREIFAPFGTIKSMRLKKPELIKNPLITKAYAIAYLEFEKEEDAANAIRGLNGTVLSGHNLMIEIFDKSQQEHISFTGSDVVGQQIVKGLFITGINKEVRRQITWLIFHNQRPWGHEN